MPARLSPCARHPGSCVARWSIPLSVAASERISAYCLVGGCCPALSQGGRVCWNSWRLGVCLLGRSHRVDSLSGRPRGWGRGESPSQAPLQVGSVLPCHRAGWLAPLLNYCSLRVRGSRTVCFRILLFVLPGKILGQGSGLPRCAPLLPSRGFSALRPLH